MIIELLIMEERESKSLARIYENYIVLYASSKNNDNT